MVIISEQHSESTEDVLDGRTELFLSITPFWVLLLVPILLMCFVYKYFVSIETWHLVDLQAIYYGSLSPHGK